MSESYICEKCNLEIIPDDDQQDEIDATDHITCPRCGAENWAGYWAG